MILILGSSGYVGQKFQWALRNKGLNYMAVSRSVFDYYQDKVLDDLIEAYKPSMIINAAGFTGKPNVEACEKQRDETILGNIVLPLTIAKACVRHDVVLGHVSSGCIYNSNDDWFQEDGFTEHDAPNFCFKTPQHSFYSGTKAQSEELIRGIPGLKAYIWRLRIPFDQYISPRNYITKMLTYPKLVSVPNSLSHLGDFTKSCVDCFIRGVEFGTYNMTNPGSLTAEGFTELWCEIHGPRKFDFWPSVEEFNKHATTPRSNCVLNTDKATKAGVGMRHITDAMKDAILLYGLTEVKDVAGHPSLV
jgi:dTDP-4-dehydrorhamnose reductase